MHGGCSSSRIISKHLLYISASWQFALVEQKSETDRGSPVSRS